MWTADNVRDKFVRFFQEHAQSPHEYIVSAPVEPKNDKSLLFVNSGMNQFKDLLLNRLPVGHKWEKLERATNYQRCIRAGGKHNDLEDVGRDGYHHTFFEMLGSWSFGSYFKSQSIQMAWELMTNVYKLDKDRLYVTYFKGDDNIPSDDESRLEWLKYLPDDRVLPFGAKENFWEMADKGPCGPCSEIHYDRIGNRNATHLVNQDDPMVVELWNLVFMQYERTGPTTTIPLSRQSVDTGMGLERIVSVLQNSLSNYDTDLFMPIIKFLETKTGSNVQPYSSLYGEADAKQHMEAYRSVADHARFIAIAVGDGIIPGPAGRGYVVRRVVRRALHYASQVLKISDLTDLTKMFDIVNNILGNVYPCIKNHLKRIKSTWISEINSFGKALEKGSLRLKRVLENSDPCHPFPAQEAFILYTSFGYPLDLTNKIVINSGFKVDEENLEELMAKHQRVSSADVKDSDKNLILTDEGISIIKRGARPSFKALASTDTNRIYDWDSLNGTGPIIETMIIAIWDGEKYIESAPQKQNVALILERTTFYPEQGGQCADSGFIEGPNGEIFFVSHVKTSGPFVLHAGFWEQGFIAIGATVQLHVDYGTRQLSGINHTAAHILNWAIRNVYGNDTEQAGQDVDARRGKFDYTCSRPLTDDEILKIENLVNKQIDADLTVDTTVMPYSLAKDIPGLRAAFGENYPELVRVVSTGIEIDSTKSMDQYDGYSHSIEFCGGTHMRSTKLIKKFIILIEESVAKGRRRFQYVTHDMAIRVEDLGQEYLTFIDGMRSVERLSSEQDRDLKTRLIELGLLDRKKFSLIYMELRNRTLALGKQEDKKAMAHLATVINVCQPREFGTNIEDLVDALKQEPVLYASRSVIFVICYLYKSLRKVAETALNRLSDRFVEHNILLIMGQVPSSFEDPKLFMKNVNPLVMLCLGRTMSAVELGKKLLVIAPILEANGGGNDTRASWQFDACLDQVMESITVLAKDL